MGTLFTLHFYLDGFYLTVLVSNPGSHDIKFLADKLLELGSLSGKQATKMLSK